MPVSATLASQFTQTFPQAFFVFSANDGGVAMPQGILTAAFSAGPVHGSPATPSGRREKGHAHKLRLPPRQGLGGTPDSVVSDVKETSKALGSDLSLYTLW
jgi:hypothetical protein